MGNLIVRRVAQMLLIMLTVSLLLFAIFDSDQFREKAAVAELGGFGVATLSDSDYHQWLEKKGLTAPFLSRYGRWLAAILHGDLGQSTEKDIEVSVLAIMGEKVRIGIQAPRDVPVFRKEVYLEIQQERSEETKGAREEVDAALRGVPGLTLLIRDPGAASAIAE